MVSRSRAWSWACYSSCLIICSKGQDTHTHARAFPALNQFLGSAATVRVETPAHGGILLQPAEAAVRLEAFLAPPETRGQGDHLGFPKIWVAREMQSREQAEQAREG